MLLRRILFGWLFLIVSATTLAQDDYNIISFKEKVTEIRTQMEKNPDEAYVKLNELLKQVREKKDFSAELALLDVECRYFIIKSDFNNLITFSQQYLKKAEEQQDLISQANACAYLSNAYALNGLYEEAESSLMKGLNRLNQIDSTGTIVFRTRGKLYTELANVSNVKKNPAQQIRYMKLAMAEHNKIPDKKLRQKFEFRDLSNLASSYYEFNIDSAEWYAVQSISVGLPEDQDNNIMFTNYLILGVANKLKNNYPEAISYYKKAEAIEKNKYYPNVEELYHRFVEIYDATGDSINSEKYSNKINLLKLKITESKNESLHKIIEENKKGNKSETYILLLFGTLILTCILAFFLIRFYRKNQILKKQEFQSQNYLKEFNSNELQDSASVKELVEIVSNNDPGFMFAFEQIFPDFRKKVLSIYPEASKSEIEFCALIKINLSTKEIARYKVIHVRSVQNRKYRIRKNLNIPAEMDIYDWFKNF